MASIIGPPPKGVNTPSTPKATYVAAGHGKWIEFSSTSAQFEAGRMEIMGCAAICFENKWVRGVVVGKLKTRFRRGVDWNLQQI